MCVLRFAARESELIRVCMLSFFLPPASFLSPSEMLDSPPRFSFALQPPKKKTEKVVENVALGPQVKEGELVFGVAHIFASFNDTFVHVTDLSGKETLVRITGTPRAWTRASPDPLD